MVLKFCSFISKTSHYEDKTIISQKLAKIFPEQKRVIQKILPENYKRAYTKPEEIPKTLLEEVLEMKEQNFKTMYELIKDIRKKVSSDKYEGLKENIQQIMTVSKSLNETLEEDKRLNAELSIIKSKGDIREKIHPFQSIILRAHLFVESLHEVANKIDQSAKWANIGHKERSEEIISGISDDLKRCLVCDWDSADFFNKNLELEKQGLEIEIPDTSQIQNGFKDSKVIKSVADKIGSTPDNVSEILTEYFNCVKNKVDKIFTN